jgi:hypothetical protein
MKTKVKKVGYLFSVLLLFCIQAKAIETQAYSEAYLTIGSVEIQDLGFVAVLGHESSPTENPPLDPGIPDSISFDNVINTGKVLWGIVKSNKPIVNVKTDSASALPEGVKDWTQLQGWKVPQARLYRMIYKNLYQMTVVDFTYRVIFTSGGNMQGKGKYLCEATIVPAQLEVAWGYTFNAEGFVQSILNVGSHTDPIGAVELRMKWGVDTYFKHSENTASFFLQGDGVFVNLTGTLQER